MDRLADKNILITGGNSGIGLAAAQEFDREGARVAICGLKERTLQAANSGLGGETSRRPGQHGGAPDKARWILSRTGRSMFPARRRDD